MAIRIVVEGEPADLETLAIFRRRAENHRQAFAVPSRIDHRALVRENGMNVRVHDVTKRNPRVPQLRQHEDSILESVITGEVIERFVPWQIGPVAVAEQVHGRGHGGREVRDTRYDPHGGFETVELPGDAQGLLLWEAGE